MRRRSGSSWEVNVPMKVDLTPAQYAICFQALAVGERQSRPTEWNEIIDLVSQLKSVGEPIPDTPDLYITKEPVHVALNTAQCRILREYIDSTNWRPLSLDKVLQVKALLEV